ncbi:hypothetical protein F8388_016680 [Cannabis sativa]|uniref:GH18 domain-containing protein n=1 Tax=Cannabis sativa TaxID=3483 RepID=A0A7J6E261_CANSA|nr:hypothetical protein F8388_016680 [Cannabis sativa]
MASMTIITLFLVFLSLKFQYSKAQSWVRAGYWFSGSEFPISDINSELFTHLICAFADVNSSSYELSISSSNEQLFSTFTNTVKQKNPSVTTLLSIGGGNADYKVFSQMVSNSSHRKSFIDSSIKLARLNGFQGLDLCWVSANTSSDMSNMGLLFKEWRDATSNSSSQEPQLILTAAVQFTPDVEDTSFPVDSIRSHLDWVNVLAYDYYGPQWWNSTAAQAALFDPSSQTNTDFGISSWIGRGISSSKLVLSLPYYGYAWKLVNPNENSIGAPASGPAISEDGSMTYKDIKSYIKRYNAQVTYNATYVVNYFSVGSTWVGFDDVEVVQVKVSYAKEKKLLGYVAWHIANDDNWVLSLTAKEGGGRKTKKKWKLLVIILTSIVTTVLIVAALLFYFLKRRLKSKVEVSKYPKNGAAAAGDFNSNIPNLRVFSLADVEAATEGFSVENKLGQGGYGPVYKAYELWKTGKGMDFMDPSLEDLHSSCKLMKCLEIALLCVQDNANDRPSMLEVSSMLKNQNATMVTPQKPTFATRNIKNQEGCTVKSWPADTSSSVNEATISEVLPR